MITYTYDMTLKKHGIYGYSLVAQTGIKVYEFTAHDDPDAMRIAQAWMSSWSSVRITLENISEQQQQKRD